MNYLHKGDVVYLTDIKAKVCVISTVHGVTLQHCTGVSEDGYFYTFTYKVQEQRATSIDKVVNLKRVLLKLKTIRVEEEDMDPEGPDIGDLDDALG